MNKNQKFLIHFSAVIFITFIMSFCLNSWSLISAFKDFFESGQKVELTAFVYEGVDEQKIKDFIAKYEKNPQVISIHRQTAEEAFLSLKSELKLFDFQMKTAEIEKVLPQIITMKLKSLNTALINEIKLNQIVDELLDGRHWLQKNENIILALKGTGFFILILCSISLILVLSLLLRTQIQFEKDEIILRAMHGQTLWSLRRTYIYKGILLTLLGSFLGIISVILVSSILKEKVLLQFQIQNLADQIKPLSIVECLLVFSLGIILSGLISFWQTAHFKKTFYLQNR